MRERSLLGLLVLCLAGCSVGFGQGEVSGIVNDPQCGLEDRAYSLDPSFFAAQSVDNEAFVSYRIQRGGHFALTSDGLRVDVNRPEEIAARLGEPIALGPLAATPEGELPVVTMTLYLNDTCEWREDVGDLATIFPAVDGSITFDAIYAPSVDGAARRTEASFTDVRFEDPRQPDVRFAIMSGTFAFDFDRGRPAQPFP